tara:strand:- start:143 stop:316 length:174 start_codon:yes stop_codon:yes gene_type:complete
MYGVKVKFEDTYLWMLHHEPNMHYENTTYRKFDTREQAIEWSELCQLKKYIIEELPC